MECVTVQAEVGEEGKGPAGMTCLVYTSVVTAALLLGSPSSAASPYFKWLRRLEGRASERLIAHCGVELAPLFRLL